ncbi:hypothetical protein E4U09_004931 [Claviceps aff. purpurea]|uniref:Uncharacterized protein n=1 Tax=Claviceps aff. purpurea TaxID=1967640 RepID=A0A9P7U4C3_9HYPO|nr:hypothetical protein E4U09_004931 [Claviceps aff. purpurea]
MASKHDGPMRFNVEPKYGGIEAPGRIRQTTRLPHDAGRPDNATVSGFVVASSRRLRPSSSLQKWKIGNPKSEYPSHTSVPHLM